MSQKQRHTFILLPVVDLTPTYLRVGAKKQQNIRTTIPITYIKQFNTRRNHHELPAHQISKSETCP